LPQQPLQELNSSQQSQQNKTGKECMRDTQQKFNPECKHIH